MVTCDEFMKLLTLSLPGILDVGSSIGPWGLGVLVSIEMHTTPTKPRHRV